MSTSQFNDALARLDAEIADTEQRLADLQLKRRGAEAFLAYMRGDEVVDDRPRQATSSEPTRPFFVSPLGQAGVAETIARENPDAVLTIDFVLSKAEAQGHHFTRDQIKNALHYLARKGLLVSVGRGAWRLPRNAETPGLAGVSGGNVLPYQEGGDSRETTEATASAAEDHSDLQLGASMTEVAS